MSPYVFNDANWVRTAEILYRGKEYTSTPLDPALDTDATPIRPGMVAVLFNGTITIADGNKAGGAFKGLFLSEVTPQLDELNGKELCPVVVQGPGTVKVLTAALHPSATFAVNPADVVELVAIAGMLAPRGTAGAVAAAPTVAHLEQVLPDGIIVQLLDEHASQVH